MCYVSCLSILGVTFKNHDVGTLWFFSSQKECGRTVKRLHLRSVNNLI